ncbi:hypothetical protein ACFCZ4_34195 [Streptomyces microflavus]|uniref:hypothetical protein n=1 Tax=Streptomyces microflavus TaxID=1919 RepID=UPI0035D53FE0
MTTIDELLSRALLVPDPETPDDPYDRLYGTEDELSAPPEPEGPDPLGDEASQDLHALCEALVSSAPASALSGFVTEQLPGPVGARVLGCILQLSDAGDGARSWWQYASGAGDRAASYCLYLHHLSLGEDEAATWWYRQTETGGAATPIPARASGSHPEGTWTVPETVQNLEPDTSTPTVLRVFRQLIRRAERNRSEVVDALMAYLPTAVAVGYVCDEPDVDLPLPGPHFAEQIGILVAAASSLHSGREEFGRRRVPPFSRRQRGATGNRQRAQEDMGGFVQGGR